VRLTALQCVQIGIEAGGVGTQPGGGRILTAAQLYRLGIASYSRSLGQFPG